MTAAMAMDEVLRLTRAGKLAEATDGIRAMLARGTPTAAPPAAGGTVIDLTPERVALSPRGGARSPAPADPERGFLRRSFAGEAGTLGYMLYVPQAAAEGMPLVVMLHGCTQSPEDFARGTAMNRLADELGFVVAYPGQARTANPQGCWNWFRPGDQRRDRGEPALIAGITRKVIAEQGIDPRRVYVAGLSAGGAMAAIMASAYPDLYAAAGIHSGLACGSARDMPGALMAMKSGAAAAPGNGGFVPVITIHGDRDATVNEANSRSIVAAAASAAGGSLRTDSASAVGAGGRRYTRTTMADAAGRILIEQLTVHGAGHAWSGGDPSGSYADAAGPDASREMLRFFLADRA